MIDTKQLLNKAEAARFLGVSPRTLDRERAVGRIRHVRVRGQIRFRQEQLEDYVRKATR
jgi:excisionase family DNA binding protein